MDRATGAIGRGPCLRVTLAAGTAASVALVVALAVGDGLPVAPPPGLPDAGAATGWGLRVVRLLARVAAVMTVGSLLVAVLRHAPGHGTRGPATLPRAALLPAVPWALAWALSSAILIVLSASDALGTPLTELTSAQLGTLMRTSRAVDLEATVLVALGVAIASRRARTPAAGRVLLVVALLALLPAALDGHASTTTDPDMASSAVAVHVVAASVWTGGLAAMLLQLRGSRGDLPVLLPRFSAVALACFVAVGVSGLLAATAQLGTSPGSWASGYGAVVAAKAVLLVALGVLGHRHRTVTVVAALRGRALAFARLAAGEVVVMAAAMGLAVALGDIAPPSTVVPAGHATDGVPSHPVPPFSWWALATAWRLDAGVLVLLGAALTAYLVGVARLTRRGLAWSAPRTASFVAGLAVLLLDLCSGVATFAPAMVSVQVGQLLVALLLAPLLLAHGDPHVLFRIAREPGAPPTGPSPHTQRPVPSPVTGATLVCLVLVAVYRTPLVEASMRSHWVSLPTLVAATASGLVLWTAVRHSVAGRRLASRTTWSLAAVASCLAVLALQLGGGDRLLAATWLGELGWSWVDPGADQEVAALLMGLAAASLLVTALVHRGPSRPLPCAGALVPGGHTRNRTRPVRSSAPTGP
jgi:putative copper resistance protein D